MYSQALNRHIPSISHLLDDCLLILPQFLDTCFLIEKTIRVFCFTLVQNIAGYIVDV